MEEIKKDVEEVVTPAPEAKDVETPADGGDDKDKNFAAVRARLAEVEAENERLRSQGTERSLEPDEETVVEKDTSTDVLKTVFQRDMKEAVKQWSKQNEVSSEEWSAIKKKVSLKGDETLSEIQEKIDEAYHSLPSVRERREQELIDKGRKEAMQQFSDEELDSGMGGGDVDFSGNPKPRLTEANRKFAKSFGLSDKDLKDIDTEQNPNDWKEGKQATRPFFQP